MQHLRQIWCRNHPGGGGHFVIEVFRGSQHMGPIMCRKRDDGLDEHAEVLDHCPTHPPPSLFIF